MVAVLGCKGWCLAGRGRGFQVGQWLPADLVGLVDGKARHTQQLLGCLVGRFGVVAFRVVVQEVAEAGRRAHERGFLLTRPPYRQQCIHYEYLV
ncbi:hypothetical protein [Streptomyces sp. NPDC001480]|uniref:hypothetical protein n=1 Tax=Streptomyces sp. NPDC001480 TaxID=3364577 RepID=UPI0036894119